MKQILFGRESITWPYNSARDGFPDDVRDAGGLGHVRWGRRTLYLHICGTPWSGNVYLSEKNQAPIWSPDLDYRRGLGREMKRRGGQG